jgi:acyl carrier protein
MNTKHLENVGSEEFGIRMTQSERKTYIDIKRKLNAFIKDKFLKGDKSRVLKDDDSFLEKGIIDSTGVLELVDYIEETFAIKIDDEELIPDNLDSLNKLTNFITKKVGYAS